MIFDSAIEKKVRELGLEYPKQIVGRSCESVGLGQEYLWQLPNTHPFYYASVIHDFEYCARLQDNSKVADARMLRNFLKLSDSRPRKAQAYLFYFVARLYGMFNY